jgi:hypothetical protein
MEKIAETEAKEAEGASQKRKEGSHEDDKSLQVEARESDENYEEFVS